LRKLKVCIIFTLAHSLFKLLAKYSPETKQEKKLRLLEAAKKKAEGSGDFLIRPKSCRWKETNCVEVRTEPYHNPG